MRRSLIRADIQVTEQGVAILNRDPEKNWSAGMVYFKDLKASLQPLAHGESVMIPYAQFTSTKDFPDSHLGDITITDIKGFADRTFNDGDGTTVIGN